MQKDFLNIYTNFLKVLCLAVAADALTNPKIAWCLTNNTYAHDVINGSPQVNEQCGFNFISSGEHPSGFTGLTFDRNLHPHVDLLVPSSVSLGNSDFSFALNFKPTYPYTGYLFHYQSTGVTGSNINAIKIWINDTTLYGSFSVSDYPDDQMSISGGITKDSWNFFGYGIDVSAGRYDVFVEAFRNADNFQNIFSNDPYLTLPGKLRIGSEWTDTPESRFSGSIAVVNIYDTRVKSSDKITVNSICADESNFNSPPTGLPTSLPANCSGLPTTNGTGIFVKVYQGIPNPKLYSPIDTYDVISSVKCGSDCLSLGSCYSFSVQASKVDKKQTCSLYSGIYTDLQPQPEVTYYKLT